MIIIKQVKHNNLPRCLNIIKYNKVKKIDYVVYELLLNNDYVSRQTEVLLTDHCVFADGSSKKRHRWKETQRLLYHTLQVS